MKDANVKINITGDASQFAKASAEAQAEAQSSAAAIAAAYNSAATAVRAVTTAAHGFKAALGELQLIVTLVSAGIHVFERVRDWITGAAEATDEFADAAKKVTESGIGTSLFSALREQAERAGIAADEFSEKLKQFKEHKITFDQLAAAIGSTADALHEGAAGPKGEMDELIEEYAGKDARRKERAERGEVEEKALRRLVKDIYWHADDFGNGADELWDKLLGIAGGDVGKARDLFNENRPWWMNRAVGVRGFGMAALGLGSNDSLLNAGMDVGTPMSTGCRAGTRAAAIVRQHVSRLPKGSCSALRARCAG